MWFLSILKLNLTLQTTHSIFKPIIFMTVTFLSTIIKSIIMILWSLQFSFFCKFIYYHVAFEKKKRFVIFILYLSEKFCLSHFSYYSKFSVTIFTSKSPIEVMSWLPHKSYKFKSLLLD